MSKQAKLEVLGGITAEQFINEYWQKKPLLIRQAFPDFQCPISADELAGLAMEEEVEARIVREHSDDGPWQPLNGPFDEGDFAQLPKTHWTLLIQQLDAWEPEISDLKQHFNFIPNWRFDDIMASYAPEGGSVGPHYDQYDVFLLQAEGRRHWRTGQRCDEHSPRVEGTPLRILRDFEESGNWILEPGDMLYLPPNIAHYGVALAPDDEFGQCITLSIGYKAPTHTQVVSHFTDYLLEQVKASSIYEDADLTLPTHQGEIPDAALEKVKKILDQYSQNPEHLHRWFGEFTTELKNEHSLEALEETLTEDDFNALIAEDAFISANEGSRFAYSLSQQGLLLFVDGQSIALQATALKFVQRLCEMKATPITQLLTLSNDPQCGQVTLNLLNQGNLYFGN